jgi:hypothetical protein
MTTSAGGRPKFAFTIKQVRKVREGFLGHPALKKHPWAKVVMVALLDRLHNETGRCRVGIETLAEIVGTSMRQVEKQRTLLGKLGLLRWSREEKQTRYLIRGLHEFPAVSVARDDATPPRAGAAETAETTKGNVVEWPSKGRLKTLRERVTDVHVDPFAALGAGPVDAEEEKRRLAQDLETTRRCEERQRAEVRAAIENLERANKWVQ